MCCNQPRVRSSLRVRRSPERWLRRWLHRDGGTANQRGRDERVVHGGSDIELVITADHPMARVQVYDAEPSLPVRRSPNEQAACGRGMHVVDALAEA